MNSRGAGLAFRMVESRLCDKGDLLWATKGVGTNDPLFVKVETTRQHHGILILRDRTDVLGAEQWTLSGSRHPDGFAFEREEVWFSDSPIQARDLILHFITMPSCGCRGTVVKCGDAAAWLIRWLAQEARHRD